MIKYINNGRGNEFMKKEQIIELVNRVDDIDKAKKIILLYSSRTEEIPQILDLLDKYQNNEEILDLLINKNFIENRTLNQIKELIKLLEECNFDKSIYAIIKNYNNTFEYQYTKAKITYYYHNDKNLDKILKFGEIFSNIAYKNFNKFKQFIETLETLNFYVGFTIVKEFKSYFNDFDDLKSLELIEKIILSRKSSYIRQIVTNYKAQCHSYGNYDIYNYETISKAIDWFLNEDVPFYYLAFSSTILQGTSLKDNYSLYKEYEKQDKNDNIYELIFHTNVYKYRSIEELKKLINIYMDSNYNLSIKILIKNDNILKNRTYEEQIELIDTLKKHLKLINGNKNFEYRVVEILTNENLLKNQTNTEINELLEKFSKLKYYKKSYDIIIADNLQYSKKHELLDYEINKKYYQKALNDFKAINDKKSLINYLENIQDEINKVKENQELNSSLVKRKKKMNQIKMLEVTKRA